MKFILIHDLLLEFLFLSPQLIEFVTVCERDREKYAGIKEHQHTGGDIHYRKAASEDEQE